MYALEDLKIKVRSPRSRRYIDEAVAAYGAAAYRSAIIATWIAVAADLIDKISVLADAGEPAAIQLRDTHKRAVLTEDVSAQLKFERDLLEKARDTLFLIGARECTELERLRDDRHLCAHPAYVTGDDDLYDPTPEQVRAHLAAAVNGLLSQGPVAGRKAIERFEREIYEAAFPDNDEKLADYLQASYLRHGTQALQTNLFKVVCKKTLDPDLPLAIQWRFTRTARQFQRLAPLEWETRANDVLDGLQDQLTEQQLMRLISGLCYVPGTWDLLREGALARIEQLLRTAQTTDLMYTYELFFGPLPPCPVADMLLDRVQELALTNADVETLLGPDPDARLLPPLIGMLSQVRSYLDGERVLRWINALVPVVSTNDLHQIVEAAIRNDQISASVLGNKQMKILRTLTESLGQDVRAVWALWDGRWDQQEPTGDAETPTESANT